MAKAKKPNAPREEAASKDPEGHGAPDDKPVAEALPGAPIGSGDSKPEAPPQPDYKDLYLRALAELDNFRKVAARERRALIDSAAEGVVRKLLEPADAFERAVAEMERLHQDAPASLQPQVLRSLEGMRALQRQIATVLASEGVERFDARGAAFDPAHHEAVARVERADVNEGTVLDVVQPGYTLRGSLLRPARVVVAARANHEPQAQPEQEEQTWQK